MFEFDLTGCALNQAYLTACKFDDINLRSSDMS
ncbi:pentapeptide repeat-containing protein [Lysinibacillus sp. Ag94]